MNVTEGARRMQNAGKWVLLTCCTLGLCLVSIGFLLLPRDFRLLSIAPILVSLLCPVLLLGAALWMAGWIVEGFAEDAH